MRPADPAVSFGPARAIRPGGPPVGPAYYRGRPLRGRFLTEAAVRSDCGQYLVLSQFNPLDFWGPVVLVLPALALWVVALGTDWWPWLRTELGYLLLGMTQLVILAFGLWLLGQGVARLRGRVPAGAPPFRLLVIDEHTGSAYRQRAGARDLRPLRARRSRGRLSIYYDCAPPVEGGPIVTLEPGAFRQLRPRQVFAGAELSAP